MLTKTHLRDGAGLQKRVTYVIQGEYAVSNDPEVTMATILGSCVSTCLFDPVAEVGGMNHFLLPFGSVEKKQQLKYGLHSMELLINGLLKMGADKTKLQAKVFGGAAMSDRIAAVGDSNQEFAISFLKDEGIAIKNISVGGRSARKVRFYPTSGHAEIFFLQNDIEPRPLENPPIHVQKPDDDIIIFS